MRNARIKIRRYRDYGHDSTSRDQVICLARTGLLQLERVRDESVTLIAENGKRIIILDCQRPQHEQYCSINVWNLLNFLALSPTAQRLFAETAATPKSSLYVSGRGLDVMHQDWDWVSYQIPLIPPGSG